MAEVFLADLEGPQGFSRRVVIKRILKRWAHNADVLSLFRDEARIGARLDHHNVVQVLDYGKSGEDTYLVLEYVEGRNLAELISAAADRGRYLPPTTVAWVSSECCSALDHIHGRTDRTGEPLDVVHRDINPANVLLSHAGEVKLTDFGVAAGQHRELKTAHGILRGTFPYMSPEQTQCRPVDGRSDIFSIGVCMYEALTARHPFAEDEDYLTIKNIQQLEPPPPDYYRSDLDSAISAIVMRCLEKSQEARYQGARALQDDLIAWLRARKSTYGASRLARLMDECFPTSGLQGDAIDPVKIALGPTSPGRANPLLDLSLLDRGPKRVGGAIEPREEAEAAVEAGPDTSEMPVYVPDDPAYVAAPDPFGPPGAEAGDFVVRATSQQWEDLNRRTAEERGLREKRHAGHARRTAPRGPVSMERLDRARVHAPGPTPARLAWLPWTILLVAVVLVLALAIIRG